MTTGPWKPIRLETYAARLTDVDVRINVTEELQAFVDVAFSVSTPDPVVATIQIKSPTGSLVVGISEHTVQGQYKANFKLSRGAYEPWYPIGYGKQPIYSVEVLIADDVCLTCHLATVTSDLRVSSKRTRSMSKQKRLVSAESRSSRTN